MLSLSSFLENSKLCRKYWNTELLDMRMQKFREGHIRFTSGSWNFTRKPNILDFVWVVYNVLLLKWISEWTCSTNSSGGTVLTSNRSPSVVLSTQDRTALNLITCLLIWFSETPTSGSHPKAQQRRRWYKLTYGELFKYLHTLCSCLQLAGCVNYASKRSSD